MSKKTIILTQILMTLLMALSMSGIMALIALGPVPGFLKIWLGNFIIAWPIALVLTQLAWPVANFIARRITRDEVMIHPGR